MAWTAAEHNHYSYNIAITQSTLDRPYTLKHYKALVEICQGYVDLGVPILYLERFSNGSKGFTGHENTTQGKRVGKTDPGYMFDWDMFLGMLKGDDTDMSWLDETIIGLNGQPVLFDIITADLSTRKQALTRKEWITFESFGFIVHPRHHPQ